MKSPEIPRMRSSQRGIRSMTGCGGATLCRGPRVRRFGDIRALSAVFEPRLIHRLPDAWRTIARPNVHFHSHWFDPASLALPFTPPIRPFTIPLDFARGFNFLFFLLSVNRSNRTAITVYKIVPTYFKFNPFVPLHTRTKLTVHGLTKSWSSVKISIFSNWYSNQPVSRLPRLFHRD